MEDDKTGRLGQVRVSEQRFFVYIQNKKKLCCCLAAFRGKKGIYVSFLTGLVKFYNCIILLQQKNHNAVMNCCRIGVYRCLGVCIPVGTISDRLGGCDIGAG